MATQAQRDHQVEKRLTRYTMMDDNRPLAASRGSAYAAAIAITFCRVFIGLALSYSDGLMVANESDSELVTSRFDA